MKILLSSIGSRGDVQPLLALGIELRKLGQEVRLCAAPNFKEWIESYGLECIPIGPDLRKLTGGSPKDRPVLPPTEEGRQQLATQTVRTQFQVIAEAARGCDIAVAAGALQIALRSIAEARNIPYVFAAYCPAILPSLKYPPPKTGGSYSFSLTDKENLEIWEKNDEEFNSRFGAVLNEERAKLGLAPVQSVRDHMFTDRPWLAADPVLAPALPIEGVEVIQTGAWMISDQGALPAEVENFLADGAPPVFLGFGSMQAYEQTGRVMVEAARELGLRSILSQGWAGLTASDTGKDFLLIGDVDHLKLFPRLTAIIHHGGAGTTTTSARPGIPQVIIPHNYDQYYWAHRVQELGVGVSGPGRDGLSGDALVQGLRECLEPETVRRAQELSGRIEKQGAKIAAERLIGEFK